MQYAQDFNSLVDRSIEHDIFTDGMASNLAAKVGSMASEHRLGCNQVTPSVDRIQDPIRSVNVVIRDENPDVAEVDFLPPDSEVQLASCRLSVALGRKQASALGFDAFNV